MASQPETHAQPAGHEPGWAVNHDVTWSYKPALIATVIAIVLFPILFLVAWAPARNDAPVQYPALRDQMTSNSGATLGQPIQK